MPKRTPSDVIVHRIEFQDTERELFEQYLVVSQANRLVDSLLSMDPKVMYMWITILEGLGFIDTVIPTLSDAPSTDEVLNALHIIFSNKPIVGGGRETKRGGFGIMDAIQFALTGQYPDHMNPNL